MNSHFTKLSQDKEVYYHDSTVLKPVQEWSGSIHRYLEYLRQNGCLYVPEYLGVTEKGYDAYRFIEGEQIHPDVWSDNALIEAGKVLKHLHDVSGKYPAVKDEVWQPWFLREIHGDTLMCHGDFAPWNIVVHGDDIVGVIDWEFAGPVNPIAELARAVILFAQLYDSDVDSYVQLPTLSDRCKQIRLFLDSYGATRKVRDQLFEFMVQVSAYETAQQCIDSNVNQDTVGPMWAVSFRARSTKWLLKNRIAIETALK